MGALDGAGLRRIEHPHGGHQFASRVGADLKPAAGGVGDGLGEHIGRTPDGAERAREGRSQTPAHGLTCDDGGGGGGGRRSSGLFAWAASGQQAGYTNCAGAGDD